MPTVIIKSQDNLPERGALLRFRLSKDSEWLYGSFTARGEARFVDIHREDHKLKKYYHWEAVYEYELNTSGTGFLVMA